MRIVSLVPSWTETLLLAGAEIVGRTRYCLYPEDKVEHIQVVGGTKDWDLTKIQELKPDIILLDQEENPRWMAEKSPAPLHVTHVTSVADMARELEGLRVLTGLGILSQWAERWRRVAENPLHNTEAGILEWGRRPESTIRQTLYVIWRKPWMTVNSNTFVGSMLEHCGHTLLEIPGGKYPQLDLEAWPDKAETLLFFSSEPYSFLERREGLAELGFPYAFANGESFSWFGIRSLQFLEGLDRKNRVGGTPSGPVE